MKVFYYEIIGRSRKLLRGYVEGKSKKEIQRFFESNHFYVQTLRFDPILTLLYFLSFEGFSDSEIENFCSNLLELLDAGIPYQETLKELSRSSNSRLVRSKIELASYFVSQEGYDLAQALERAKFPSQLVSVINVGLKSSNLNNLLREYIDFKKWQSEAKRKIRNSVAYPLFLIVVSYVFMLGQAFFVFPKLKELFENSQDLPFLTKIMLDLSQFSSRGVFGMVIIFFLISLCFFGFLYFLYLMIKYLIINADPKSFLGRTKLAVFIRMVMTAFFLNSLRFSIRSGLPYQKALEISKESLLLKRTRFSQLVEEAIEKAKRGLSFEDTMKMIYEHEPYAQFFLAGLGKKDVTQVLDRAVEILKKRVERQIEPVSSILKFSALAVVGIIISLILFSTYFPIYSQMLKTY